MIRTSFGPLSLVLGSVLCVGCEAPSSAPDEESSFSTSTQSGEQTPSTLGVSSRPSGPQNESDLPSTQAPGDLSSESRPSTSSTSSSTETLSTSDPSGPSSGDTQPNPAQHRIEFSVPDYKTFVEEGQKDLRLAVAPMGARDASSVLVDEPAIIGAQGSVAVELGEPATSDPSQASKLRQFMVTLYRDKDDNGQAGPGDEFIATALEFLVFRADMEPKLRWRKFNPESLKAVAIEAAIPLVEVWHRKEVKEVLLGGKTSGVPKDMVSVALFSDLEKRDLKNEFKLAPRSLDYKIPKNKLFWEAKVSGRMDPQRWAEEKKPVLAGMGRHGLSWFGGYHTPTTTIFPTVRRNSKITDELCHLTQPLVAIWIEPSKQWVQSMAGAFVVAYHDLTPGWNVVKIDRSTTGRVTFHQISQQDRYELTFSPLCIQLEDDSPRALFDDLTEPAFPHVDML